MRRPQPVFGPRQSVGGFPLDVVVVVGAVAIMGLVAIGLRRGLPWSLVLLAIVMLGIGSRTPRTQDLITAHQGILVLGAGSAALLFLVFLILRPVAESIGPVWSDVRQADGLLAGRNGVVAFLLIVLLFVGDELFWRGFVQGRLALDFNDKRRAYGMTLAGYVTATLLSGNLALTVAAFVCGAAWGWFRLRSGSIVPSLLSHLLWGLLMIYVYPT